MQAVQVFKKMLPLLQHIFTLLSKTIINITADNHVNLNLVVKTT